MRFHRILIAIDGSRPADAAADAGLDLARDLDAQVAFVFVVEPPVPFAVETGVPVEVLTADSRRFAKGLLVEVQRRAETRLKGKPLEMIVEGRPAEMILQAAIGWKADLIVVGSHGRGGLKRLALGSIAELVMRHAPCPVLVVRTPEPAPPPAT